MKGGYNGCITVRVNPYRTREELPDTLEMAYLAKDDRPGCAGHWEPVFRPQSPNTKYLPWGFNEMQKPRVA